MALNAVTGQRSSGPVPPNVVNQNININVTSNRQHNTPPHQRPRPRNPASSKALDKRNFYGRINFVF